ncbi:MAG: exonuclease domain-containing protein [Mycoplasma sp.]
MSSEIIKLKDIRNDSPFDFSLRKVFLASPIELKKLGSKTGAINKSIVFSIADEEDNVMDVTLNFYNLQNDNFGFKKYCAYFGLSDTDTISKKFEKESIIDLNDLRTNEYNGKITLQPSFFKDKEPSDIFKIVSKPQVEIYDGIPRVEFLARSNMNVMTGLNEPEEILEEAVKRGIKTIAIIDDDNVQSIPETQNKLKKINEGKTPEEQLKVIYGSSLPVIRNNSETLVLNPNKDTVLKEQTYVVFDLETTGLFANYDEITEFGAVKIQGGKVIDSFQSFVKIESPKISPLIQHITGITIDMLQHAPTFKTLHPKLKEYIGDATLIAHNGIKFDIRFLNALCRKHGLEEFNNPLIDTLQISRAFFGTTKNTMKSLATNCKIPYNENEAHRADYDAKVLADIWLKILEGNIIEGREEIDNKDENFWNDVFKTFSLNYDKTHKIDFNISTFPLLKYFPKIPKKYQNKAYNLLKPAELKAAHNNIVKILTKALNKTSFDSVRKIEVISKAWINFLISQPNVVFEKLSEVEKEELFDDFTNEKSNFVDSYKNIDEDIKVNIKQLFIEEYKISIENNTNLDLEKIKKVFSTMLIVKKNINDEVEIEQVNNFVSYLVDFINYKAKININKLTLEDINKIGKTKQSLAMLANKFPPRETFYLINQEGVSKMNEAVSYAHIKSPSARYIKTKGVIDLGIEEEDYNRLITGENFLKTNGVFIEDSLFNIVLNDSDEKIKEEIKRYDFISIPPPEQLYFSEKITEQDAKNLIIKIINFCDELGKDYVAVSNSNYLFKKQEKKFVLICSSKGVGGKQNKNLYQKIDDEEYSKPNFSPHFVKSKPITPKMHLTQTTELMEIFSSFLKPEQAEKIVNATPDKISKIFTTQVKPMQEKFIAPELVFSNEPKPIPQTESEKKFFEEVERITSQYKEEGAEEKRTAAIAMIEEVYNNARNLYGFPFSNIIQKRIEKEIKAVVSNGFSVIYWISHLLVKKSKEAGYIVGSRGSVGSSLLATFLNITEINPIVGHYVCPKCKAFEIGTGEHGYDLPAKICGACGIEMKQDGHDIEFETFLGFDGDKIPDIDLNFSSEYQSQAHDFIIDTFGKDFAFKAGTISKVQTASLVALTFKFLEKYQPETLNNDPKMKKMLDIIKKEEEENQNSPKDEFEEENEQKQSTISINNSKVQRKIDGLNGPKKNSAVHPGGVLVLNKEKNIYDYTPVQLPADQRYDENGVESILTTHHSYTHLHDAIPKLDILGHVNPTFFKKLFDITKVHSDDIPMNDKSVIKMFTNADTYAIPEFGTKFAIEALKQIKPGAFADLISCSGLFHGTGVYIGNAKDLMEAGYDLKNIPACRDDILKHLTQKWNIDPTYAFKIMEKVRKGVGHKSGGPGKNLTEEEETFLREKGVPEYYIDAMNKIQYMFPKAHAAAYVSEAYKLAWYKKYYPTEFYAMWLSTKAGDGVNSIWIEEHKEWTETEFGEKIPVLKTKAQDEKIETTPKCDNRDLTKLSIEQPSHKLLVEELQTRNSNMNKNVKTVLSAKESAALKVLEIIEEIKERPKKGLEPIKLSQIDLYNSYASDYRVNEKTIIFPFQSIPGLGQTVALSLEKARNINVENEITQEIIPYSNLNDLIFRCNLVGKAPSITQLKKLASLGVLPKNIALEAEFKYIETEYKKTIVSKEKNKTENIDGDNPKTSSKVSKYTPTQKQKMLEDLKTIYENNKELIETFENKNDILKWFFKETGVTVEKTKNKITMQQNNLGF